MPAARDGSRSSSVRSRVLLAIALTVAFYVLSLLMAVVLIGGPIAVWAVTDRGSIPLTIVLIGAGLAILRSMFATRAEFEPPGPELSRDEQPELHALLDEVAAASGEPVPDAVYLDLAVNAAAGQYQRQRFLLLGLPLFATLDRDELRFIAAHELGHYAGGDLRFEAWIWRSRDALMQTVSALRASKSSVRRATGAPFVAYAKLFMQITNAVRRRAEFDADAAAARVASADVASQALRRITALGPAFDGYMSVDVLPMLNAERLPPITEGFTLLAARAELAPGLDELVGADLSGVDPDPYASHPTLGQRLEALGEPAVPAMPPSPVEPASSLLHDLPKLERALLARQLGPRIEGFEPAGWEQAGDVHLAKQRELAGEYGAIVANDETIGDAARIASGFAPRPPAELRRQAASVRAALREALDPSVAHSVDQGIDALAIHILAATVIVAAADAGAEVTAAPGEPVRIWVDGRSADPLPELAAVATGDKPAEGWTEMIAPMRLASVPLVDVHRDPTGEQAQQAAEPS